MYALSLIHIYGEAAGDAYACEKAAEIVNNTLKRTGTNIIVEGADNIPKDRNFVLIANHQSMLDIFAIVSTLNRPIGFIAKAELKKAVSYTHLATIRESV